MLLVNLQADAQQLKLGKNPNQLRRDAILELNSDKQGLLLPRINDTLQTPINTAADGMLIFLTADNTLRVRANGIWQKLVPDASTGTGIKTLNGLNATAQTFAITNNDAALAFNSTGTTHTLNLPIAGTTYPGLLSIVPQTISGTKTFTNEVRMNNGLSVLNNAAANFSGNVNISTLTPGSLLFAGAAGTVSQSNADLFWNNTNKSMGIGNATPGNKLEISGVANSPVSGLRLTGLGTAAFAPGFSSNRVLSVNNNGDVVVINNPASSNWLFTGNANIANGSFLGTTDDKAMVIKSNNNTFLEFGRRQTLGLTIPTIPGYTNNDENVMHIRSTMQFYSPTALFYYQPKFFIDGDGDFRMIGNAGSSDFFQFGATGTGNNGGFDFIIGDDGDEPIVFKSDQYNRTPRQLEIMRLQGDKVGIGMNGATPTANLDVAGNVKLGDGGTVFNSVLKSRQRIDATTFNAGNNGNQSGTANHTSNFDENGFRKYRFNIDGVTADAAIIANPRVDLSTKRIAVAYARVVSAGVVEITFTTSGPTGVAMGTFDIDITAINF
ncbi:hypothetical protein CK934_27730 [Chitinophaga sp. MD30]|nr:hypothetical protein CK934_27730 [Chitinophaga sp. MD30]